MRMRTGVCCCCRCLVGPEKSLCRMYALLSVEQNSAAVVLSAVCALSTVTAHNM
jgi:hypothetical protein